MSAKDTQLPKIETSIPLQRVRRMFPSDSSYASVVGDLVSHEYTLNISDKRALVAYGQEMGRRYMYGSVAGSFSVSILQNVERTQVHQGSLLLPCLSS
jgi:hypothetical protein